MSQVAMSAATECGFEIYLQPPYNPDMAPPYFYLFLELKSHLCGTQYGSNEGVIEAVHVYLGEQGKAFYFEGIRKLEQRWDMSMPSREVIFKSKGQIFIHQRAENVLIIPCIKQ